MTGRLQRRPGGAWETSRKRGLYRRLTLRRADGRVYLNRWGVSHDRIGGVLLHRMDAPDPGVDLHDHPWWFCSIILWGGYVEERCDTATASGAAGAAERVEQMTPTLGHIARGRQVIRFPGSVRVMRLSECHRVTELLRRRSWSLVIKGPRRTDRDDGSGHNVWGFYLPDGFMPEDVYDETVRADRRDLWSDQAVEGRPW